MSSSSFDRAMAGPSKDDSDAKKDDGDAAQTAQSTKSLATTTTAVTSEEHAVESLSALTAHSVSLAAATATPSDERAATDVGLSVSQAADLSRRRVQIRRENIRSRLSYLLENPRGGRGDGGGGTRPEVVDATSIPPQPTRPCPRFQESESDGSPLESRGALEGSSGEASTARGIERAQKEWEDASQGFGRTLYWDDETLDEMATS